MVNGDGKLSKAGLFTSNRSALYPTIAIGGQLTQLISKTDQLAAQFRLLFVDDNTQAVT